MCIVTVEIELEPFIVPLNRELTALKNPVIVCSWNKNKSEFSTSCAKDECQFYNLTLYWQLMTICLSLSNIYIISFVKRLDCAVVRLAVKDDEML